MDNTSENDLATPTTYKLRLLQFDSIILAVPEDHIAAVVPWHEPTPLPFAPPSLVGVVCIDGRMFTVLNPGALLSPGESAPGAAPRGKLVALTGDEQLALAVDETKEVIEVSATDIRPAEESAIRLIGGILRSADQQVYVLDISELFPSILRGRERRRRRY